MVASAEELNLWVVLWKASNDDPMDLCETWVGILKLSHAMKQG